MPCWQHSSPETWSAMCWYKLVQTGGLSGAAREQRAQQPVLCSGWSSLACHPWSAYGIHIAPNWWLIALYLIRHRGVPLFPGQCLNPALFPCAPPISLTMCIQIPTRGAAFCAHPEVPKQVPAHGRAQIRATNY